MRIPCAVLALVPLWGCSHSTTPNSSPTRTVEVFGESLAIPVEPARLLATNTGALELLEPLVGAARIVAIPEVGMEYAVLDPADWQAHATFVGFDAESVLALNPDLVVAHEWQSLDTVNSLRTAGVAVLRLPNVQSWGDIGASVEALGRVLDEEARANELLAELETRRAALAADETLNGIRVLVYGNYGSGGSTAGTDTTYGLMIELAGMINAAAEAGMRGHSGIDIERLVTMDPDLLMLADWDEGRASTTLAELAEHPAAQGLRALAGERVVTLPRALFSTSSHHLLDAAEELASRAKRALDHE